MEKGKIKVWLPAIRAGSGADFYTLRLAAALERHGLTTEVTWFALSDELLPALLQHAQPPAGTDIIIANSWNAFAFKRIGLPLVAIVHHCVFDPELRPYKSTLQYFYHRFLAEPREVRSLHSADTVVAVSHYVADYLRQKLGMDSVKVIHNWVDTDLFKPKLQEARRVGPFRLMFAGKFSRLKGSDLLAPLMRRLDADFELYFTGSPQDFKELCLPANMIPIGRLLEQGMIRAYQDCDALLLPSRSEGFGYTALEAMACGKPVIASNNSALPEIVVDGVTGILCETGAVVEFANACQLLRDDPGRCLDMGSLGRQRVEKKFSEAKSIESYIQLIHKF